ncbi:MAG: c-type cytochrome, partial [Desulfuromonadales bacterium]
MDPYISGAVFQEVAENGGAILQTSGTTNAQGLATFSKPLTPGSIIELVSGKTGSDSQNPFSGILKRNVGPSNTGTLVASPLTTLVANGATAQNVVQDLQLAGLTGISAEDINRDPMAALDTTQQNVTDDQLKLLQANMAVNAFMSAVNTSAGAYDLNAQTLEDPNQAALFTDIVSAAQQILDPSLFQQLADQVQATSAAPVTLGDFINTGADMLHSIASQVNADVMSKGMQNLSPDLVSTLLTNSLNQAPGIMQGIYTNRTGVEAGSGSGGSTTPDGATLYTNDCAGCHGALATSTKAGATAAQIQAAIDSNTGGMGTFSSLTAAEVQAIA